MICGLGGDDVVVGLGGDDVLVGGPGSDYLVPGAGRDRVLGGLGNDFVARARRPSGHRASAASASTACAVDRRLDFWLSANRLA